MERVWNSRSFGGENERCTGEIFRMETAEVTPEGGRPDLGYGTSIIHDQPLLTENKRGQSSDFFDFNPRAPCANPSLQTHKSIHREIFSMNRSIESIDPWIVACPARKVSSESRNILRVQQMMAKKSIETHGTSNIKHSVSDEDVGYGLPWSQFSLLPPQLEGL